MEHEKRVKIRPVSHADRPWVTETVAGNFGSARIVSRGVRHDCSELHGLLAVENATPCGVLLYALGDAECEVVVLISVRQRSGIAAGLLGAVQDVARDAGCRRLWLVTTNDNQPAIDFYRGRGWSLKAVHENAVTEARRVKPEIPRLGHNGVPIRDELEFELLLSNGDA
jgi:GNAT superfamily N-acetyltransferase